MHRRNGPGVAWRSGGVHSARPATRRVERRARAQSCNPPPTATPLHTVRGTRALSEEAQHPTPPCCAARALCASRLALPHTASRRTWCSLWCSWMHCPSSRSSMGSDAAADGRRAASPLQQRAITVPGGSALRHPSNQPTWVVVRRRHMLMLLLCALLPAVRAALRCDGPLGLCDALCAALRPTPC
jgi:hypothetical protein